MVCPHCQNQLPDNVNICFHCGKPCVTASQAGQYTPPPQYPQPESPPPQPTWQQEAPPPQPIRQQEAPARGPRKLNLDPLPAREMHPHVQGTGMIFLLGLLTWLTAFIWPFVLLARIARGLWELIPQLLDGSVTGFAGSFWESFNLENFSGTNAAAFSAWNTANEIFKAVGGLFNFILGMFLVLVVLILMLSLLVALRKNIGAARGYMVANLILCALGNLLSYSVIKRMSDTIEVLQPPYHNIPTLALIMTAVVALLWIISILYYTSLVAKSKKLA